MILLLLAVLYSRSYHIQQLLHSPILISVVCVIDSDVFVLAEDLFNCWTKETNVQQVSILAWPCVQAGHIYICMIHWYVSWVCIYNAYVKNVLELGIGEGQTSGRCSRSYHGTDLLRGIAQWMSAATVVKYLYLRSQLVTQLGALTRQIMKVVFTRKITCTNVYMFAAISNSLFCLFRLKINHMMELQKCTVILELAAFRNNICVNFHLCFTCCENTHCPRWGLIYRYDRWVVLFPINSLHFRGAPLWRQKCC
jgi:hypothetical protein